MKQEQIIYTCDQCGKEVLIHKGYYAGTILASEWIRVYMKAKPSDVQKTKYHFCSKGCVANYMMDAI